VPRDTPAPMKRPPRDTPARGARASHQPGISASTVVAACLGVSRWSTVDHNI